MRMHPASIFIFSPEMFLWVAVSGYQRALHSIAYELQLWKIPIAGKKIVNSKIFLKRFGEIQGDRLKRPPRGYDPDHELLHDLKLKSFFIKRSLSGSDAQLPKFIDDVNKIYTEAAPLMKFLTNSVGLPF
jgi:uncharacterized protein (DUF2461 family)